MSKPKTPREILIAVAMNGRKGKGKHNERVIIQALQEIGEVLKEKMPKRKSYCDNVINPTNEIDRQISNDVDSVKTGYNQALSEINKIIEEVFGE